MVITARFDATADRAIHEMNERGIPVLRFDLSEFPRHATVTARLEGGTWCMTLATARRQVDLGEVTGIYYRRPAPVALDPAMNPDEATWAAAEARHALGGLLASLPARQWLNHPTRAAAAEAKPVQLREALRHGLLVPSTLITNDPHAALAFAAEHRQVCYKPLTSATIPGPGGEQVVYTVRLTAADLAGEHAIAIRRTAHQFQQWIEAAFAVRLVVVDGAIYPAAIHAHSDAARVDWRSDYAHLTYETVTVPRAVRDSAVSLARGLGLRFSSMDLLVDWQDRWWFIDLNPSGQWCWIPTLDDQVAAALAEALAKGPP